MLNETDSKPKSLPKETSSFVLQGNFFKSKIPIYNGLSDKHLTNHFENEKIRKHLLKMELVNNKKIYVFNN